MKKYIKFPIKFKVSPKDIYGIEVCLEWLNLEDYNCWLCGWNLRHTWFYDYVFCKKCNMKVWKIFLALIDYDISKTDNIPHINPNILVEMSDIVGDKYSLSLYYRWKSYGGIHIFETTQLEPMQANSKLKELEGIIHHVE